MRLERALGEFGAGPRTQPPDTDAPLRGLSRLSLRLAVGATVAAAVLVAVAWIARPGRASYPPAAQGTWTVAAVSGAPTLGERALSGEARADAGATLSTDEKSRARVDVANLGHVEVAPSSTVRLLATGGSGHRIALDRGRISALTWAPPRTFFVETPTAVAADLGCSFTLDVDAAGVSHLVVSTGWVAFERGGIEAVVPAGAECRSKPGIGPGTPFFSDAPAVLLSALSRFDFEGGKPEDVDVVLAAARFEDALTLWHLLPRVPSAVRPRVYDRLASLSPPPAGVTRDAALSLDKAVLEAWRDSIRKPR